MRCKHYQATTHAYCVIKLFLHNMLYAFLEKWYSAKVSIEHRLFPHITRACQGVVFKTVELVNEYMAKAKTTTGLKVFTRILKRTFETGRKVADDFKKNMRIQFDESLL